MRKGVKKVGSSTKLSVEQAQATSATHDQTPAVQKALDKVTKERLDLSRRLEEAHREVEFLKAKLRTVTEKLVNSVKPCPFDADKIEDLASIAEQDIVHLISILTSKEKNKSFEERIEELETRITLLDTELGKMVHLKCGMEEALNSLSSCQDLQTLQQGVRRLWLQSCSTKIFIKNNELVAKTSDAGEPELGHSLHNGMAMSAYINLESVEMHVPTKRLPGDTHIKDMYVNLRELVVRELSLFKKSGADWRMFAVRVGVPERLVAQWLQMKQQQPMRNVLGVWASSPAATVRMLHRHLVSPQLRCVVLAKRISDYYEVD